MGLFFTRMYDAFASFGTGKPTRILMLGLDAAGKTTILYKVKLDENIQAVPTIGFNVETVSPCPGVTFTVWDVGGQKQIRALWHHYAQGAEGLIFVIDSNDPERIEEAREELHGILDFPDMSNVPIVIIANKQDLPNAMKPSDIINQLGMNNLHGKHKWYIQSACAVTGEGLVEAMLEMANLAKQYRRENNY